MRLFLAALALVYAALAGVSIAQTTIPDGTGSTGPRLIALNIFLIPVLSAWAAAELATLIRRPRLLDSRLRFPVARPALGAAVAIAGAVFAAMALPWVDRYAPDSVTTGAAAALPTLAAVLLLRPARRGRCIHCDYDLTTGPAPGQPGFGLCPECGASVLQPR